MDSRTVGVLGGGQLGRMLMEAGHRLGGSSSPAGQIASIAIEGSFQDGMKIKELASISDIITTEIEHVNTDILEELERTGHVVQPSSRTIRMIQDKYLQKVHLSEHDIPLPDFMATPTIEAARIAGIKYGYPLMLKNRKLAYDGRGNVLVPSENDLETGFAKLNHQDIYAEKFVPFAKELAVMIVKTKSTVLSYPVVETIQEENICHVVMAPAQISTLALQQATSIASRAVASFDGVGIYGVELFLLPDDSVLLNEIAPRPHNSGHYTMEACPIDQFEMHLRAILDLPCPPPVMRTPYAMMINVLGKETLTETKAILQQALQIPGAGIHWYGKNECRKGRKMAHFTITASSSTELKQRISPLATTIPCALTALPTVGPRVGIIMGSDSDLPIMQEAAKILESFHVSYDIAIVSAHRTPTRMYSYAQTAIERGLQVIIAGAGGAAHLPGMVASLTSLPVIGVPIKTSILNGNDSLLSIVQMPKGIPVATVAIDNAANAGLLAVRILGAQDSALQAAMEQYLLNQEEEVLRKSAKLESIGYAAYLQK